MNILDKITARRFNRIEAEGPELGSTVPPERRVPLVPFGREPFVIAEIKRKSPSRGRIDPIYDPVKRADMYLERGIRSMSILTEEDYFAGSLDDLMLVKKNYPQLSILRKDFLLTRDDIEVSYRAGADAVLLIAAVLEADRLAELYQYARELGMKPLVELHSEDDMRKAEAMKPDYTGINARDLSTFKVDPLHPIRLKSSIPWESSVVYESGIQGSESAELAGRSGFAGILVGESVVRNPDAIPGIISGFERGKSWRSRQNRRSSAPETEKSYEPAAETAGSFFWEKLFSHQRPESQLPLVKICGLTRLQDVMAADKYGADILGFILAKSPRQTDPDFIRSIGATRGLKVAVVVGADSPPMNEVRRLLQDGILDAVQFHGEEEPQQCYPAAYPYYKALALKHAKDIEKIGAYRCPRVLVDAFHKGASGGTGKVIAEELLDGVREKHPLWLAGGLNPGNIAEIVARYSPELVDASSGLESAPGVKDEELIRQFIHLAKKGGASDVPD